MAATATEAFATCSHCGLPVRGNEGTGTILYCCHACRLVAGIIGSKEGGDQAWRLLRLSFGALLAMNVMMLSLLLYAHAVDASTIPVFRWTMLALSTPAVAILLWPLVRGIVHCRPLNKAGLDLLIVVGSASAFTVSATNTIVGSGPVFFDTATMLPVLVTFGKLIEATAKKKAADLLHAMESLLPATALKIADDSAEEVSLDRLQPGDLVRIRAGERVAVDGLVLEGVSTIDEAAFTGEPLPRSKGPGDRVLAGTVNGEGSMVVVTERTGQAVLLQRIIATIHAALEQPSPAERMAERAAGLFLPTVGVTAGFAFVFWSLAGNPLQGWFSALAVLVVACPCTMGIATPLATSLAISRAAAAGIIVRGGETMEQLGRTDLVFFDKTGTVTGNRPVLCRIVPTDPQVSEDRLLAIAATLESGSAHPLAQAIAAEAAQRGVAFGTLSNFEIIPGQGIGGLIELNGETLAVTAGPATGADGGKSPEIAIAVTCNGMHWGALFFADRVRDDAPAAVTALARQGIATVLLSGDRLSTASAIAAQAGIGQLQAQQMPVEKLEAVEKAMAEGKNVAMVGDGINDAAALIAAPVGIAIGSGLEVARQAGNVVLLSDRLLQIPWLIDLSRQTRRIIAQNFAWSFGYNTIALAAAAAGLLHPLLAALAMVGSSLTVLANSVRIGRFPAEETHHA